MFMMKLWEKKATLVAFHKKNALPEMPGVYFFLGADDEILYIGKATSLRDRVKSYFTQDITETRGPKIVLMLEKAVAIACQKTDSVLEALILEARLVKQHLPPYNTDLKDDKSYNHVVITDERFPHDLHCLTQRPTGRKRPKKIFHWLRKFPLFDIAPPHREHPLRMHW